MEQSNSAFTAPIRPQTPEELPPELRPDERRAYV